MTQPNLVLLDFDGTLVHTAPDLVRTTNIFLERRGIQPLDAGQVERRIGLGLHHLLKEVLPADKKITAAEMALMDREFLEIYDREFLNNPTLYEGSLEFLTEWDGNFAIVSNKRSRYIGPILEKLEIHNLPWVRIIGGDTYSNMKPHPEPFLAAIEAAGSRPEETIVVGDGIPDVLGAQAIGSLCVAVAYGYAEAEDLMAAGAWKTIDGMAELLPLLRSIR